MHSTLLRAGIPIVEHLRGLELLPASGIRFSAVPPKIAGPGTFPVRAHAHLEDDCVWIAVARRIAGDGQR